MKQKISNEKKMMGISSALLLIFLSLKLTSCGPSEAELERRALEKIEKQNQREQPVDNKVGKLVSVSDTSMTTFKIPTDYGSTYNGRLITVKHDGCEYVVWFNQWGQQTMHKPNCNNPQHIK